MLMCLFQQYFNDAYACIEECRLQWIRINQKEIRAKMYNGLQDAIAKGDTDLDQLVIILCMRYCRPSADMKESKVKHQHVDQIIYTIEFQKTGLTQAPILLWLRRRLVCFTFLGLCVARIYS